MIQDTIFTILLSWASQLSGYPIPADPPEVRFEQHEFFVENVCAGQECNVVGWYNDANVVFIDRQYYRVESEFGTSLVVHEFVHFLQHKSGDFDSKSCIDSVAREREAYRVQNDYIVKALGSINMIRHSPTSCNYAGAGTWAKPD